ncbi:hypothetical protein [Methanothermococcus okinawensis]|uniref:PrcB C-terminal domain-containing protein n=1 Tax=Methanothermococcus okinawensis (strain DSM 14208 / JCM 11175 / IH1) TaxID=647113 RepID=F8ALZ9_METOI|nr:hypothetical protein [Methanothermococcus okinawensis]AEH06674.1 hypothetical protein Metok_0697 [Methanothermococcus okinawensis IH1]
MKSLKNKLLLLFSIFAILLMVSLSSCLDFFNDDVNIHKTINNKNITIKNSSNFGYNRALNGNKNVDKNNKNKDTYSNCNNLPIPINYTILEYGQYGKYDKKYYCSYIDNRKNTTIICVYGGKKPNYYSIKIAKIIKNSNEDITVYVSSTVQNNNSIVITSPYEIVEVNGIYKNVKFIDTR